MGRDVDNARLCENMEMTAAKFELFIRFDTLSAAPDLGRAYTSILYDGLAVQTCLECAGRGVLKNV